MEEMRFYRDEDGGTFSLIEGRLFSFDKNKFVDKANGALIPCGESLLGSFEGLLNYAEVMGMTKYSLDDIIDAKINHMRAYFYMDGFGWEGEDSESPSVEDKATENPPTEDESTVKMSILYDIGTGIHEFEGDFTNSEIKQIYNDINRGLKMVKLDEGFILPSDSIKGIVSGYYASLLGKGGMI